MKSKHIKTIDWRPDLFEKATKELFVCAEQCHNAGLYKLEDGRVIYHAYCCGKGAHVALFFVDGEYQRRGIGRKLFERCPEDNNNHLR